MIAAIFAAAAIVAPVVVAQPVWHVLIFIHKGTEVRIVWAVNCAKDANDSAWAAKLLIPPGYVITRTPEVQRLYGYAATDLACSTTVPPSQQEGGR